MNANNKKIVLRIHKSDTSSVYGILTQEILEEVCAQTGLDEREVLDSLDRLEALGVIDKEITTLH